MRTRHLVLAVVLCCVAVVEPHALSVRQIPDTVDNTRWVDVVSQVLASDDTNHNCSLPQPDQQEVFDCIETCASIGGARRGDCCCYAKEDLVSFGRTNGCAYTQQLRVDDQSLFYFSFPTDPISSFNESCFLVNDDSFLTGDHTCDCHLQWQLSRSDLREGTVLPTSGTKPISPSPSPTSTQPVTNPPPTASLTPTPSATSESQPTTSPSPTSTPSPSSSASSSSSPGPTLTFPPGVTVEISPSSTSSPSVSASEQTSTDSPGPSFTPGQTPVETMEGSPGVATNEPPSASSPSASPSPEDSSVCVDERYLIQRGYKSQDYVHQDGPIVPVLCPVIDDLPCGTPNHKLRVAGIDVSYKQFCSWKDVQCSTDVLKVNSVWSHAWQDTNHAHVVLTMYDVRYPEIAQRLLHRAMSRVRASRQGHA